MSLFAELERDHSVSDPELFEGGTSSTEKAVFEEEEYNNSTSQPRSTNNNHGRRRNTDFTGTFSQSYFIESSQFTSLTDAQNKHNKLLSDLIRYFQYWCLTLGPLYFAYSSTAQIYVFYARQNGAKHESVVSITLLLFYFLHGLSDFVLLWLADGIHQSSLSSSLSYSDHYRYGFSEKLFMFQYTLLSLGMIIQALCMDFAMLTFGLMLSGIGLCTPQIFTTFLVRLLPQSEAIQMTQLSMIVMMVSSLFGNIFGGLIADHISLRGVFALSSGLCTITTLATAIFLFGREMEFTNRMLAFTDLYRRCYHMNQGGQNNDDGLNDDWDMFQESKQFPIARKSSGLLSNEEQSIHQRLSESQLPFVLNEQDNRELDDWSSGVSLIAHTPVYKIILSWEFLPTLLAVIYLCLTNESAMLLWLNPYMKDRFGTPVIYANSLMVVSLVTSAMVLGLISKKVIPRMVDNHHYHHQLALPSTIVSDHSSESIAHTLEYLTCFAYGIPAMMLGCIWMLVAPEVSHPGYLWPLMIAFGVAFGLSLAINNAEFVRGNVSGLEGKIGAMRILIVNAFRGFAAFLPGLLWDVHTPSVLTDGHSECHLWFFYVLGLSFLIGGIIAVWYYFFMRPIRESKLRRNGYSQILDH